MSDPTDPREDRARLLDLALLRRLWPFLRPYAGSFMVALAMVPLIAVLALGKPWILKRAVDEHLVPGVGEGLGRLGAMYFGLLLAESALKFGYTYLTQRTGQLGLSGVRREVFRRYQAFSQADMDAHPVGRLMTRATTDIEALSQMFQSGLLAIFSDLLTLAGIFGFLFYLEARLASYLLVILPLAYLVTDWFQVRMRKSFRRAREQLAAMNAFVQENVAGIEVVKLFDLGADHRARFAAMNREYRDAYHRSNLYDAGLYSTMEFTRNVSIALFLWGGSYLVASGAITLGVMVAFIESMGRFFDPLRDLSSKFAVMQSAMAAAEKVVQVLDHIPAVRDPAAPLELPAGGTGRVEFRGVSFRYRDDTPVLRGVDIAIEAGEKVAIVGPTGAGKTTLIKLLERFYDPNEGAVLLDGVDVRAVRLADLRRRLAVVLQDVFLVRGSVAENIRLGAEDVDDAAVRRACETVEADAFIARMGGYEARIEEGASNLSAGERQLISFARALVRDPRVLILDEATANVDVETEAKLQRAMTQVLAGRTALIIAHRLSTIRTCDRVLVMRDGRVVESGSHDDLIAAGGVYAKLYHLQEKDAAGAGDGPRGAAAAG